MHLYIGNKVYSSWSLRPWMVLGAFAIPFTETVIPLRDGDTRDRILEYSPSGKVPCLVDGDTTVWDSLAIIEYLADRFPEHAIWPRDRSARAHARCVSAEMHSGFQALRQACQMTVTKRFAPSPRPAAVLEDVARVTAIWREARARYGEKATGAAAGPFLYGAFSAADAMFTPVVTRFHTYALPADATSMAYIAAVLGHPTYRAWLDGAVHEPWFLTDNDEVVIEDLRANRASGA